MGVAPAGGVLCPSWIAPLRAALAAGLSIVSGLHQPLTAVPALVEAAQAAQQTLIDIRIAPNDIPIASGRRSSWKALTDCRYRLLCRKKIHGVSYHQCVAPAGP